MRRVITIDIDGVVAGGGYVHPNERSEERYMACGLREPQVVECINRLTYTHNVYFVSSRNHNNALTSTRDWLSLKGVEMERVMGTIVGIPAYNKPHICRMLGAAAHFDDDPAACNGSFCWLVDNPTWPHNQDTKHLYTPQVVSNWDEILEVIYTKLPQQHQQMVIPFPEVTICG